MNLHTDIELWDVVTMDGYSQQFEIVAAHIVFDIRDHEHHSQTATVRASKLTVVKICTHENENGTPWVEFFPPYFTTVCCVGCGEKLR